jgi:uncharacterized small protein (DUF1192 family)
MQIVEIVLYSRDGRRRTVSLRLGALNVITGDSQSGKSAVLEIIRYCLGSSEYRVPAGVIADKVSWFGALLAIEESRVFVARPAPAAGRQTTGVMMLGYRTTSPDFGELRTTTNTEGVQAELERLIGLQDNVAPTQHGTQPPVRARLDHAMIYSFQRQTEIADQEHLFHRQSESFVAMHIRDTLPYFLGAVDPEYIIKVERLRSLRREHRVEQGRLATAEAFEELAGDDARILLGQAADVGLIEPRPWEETGDVEVLQRWLQNAASAPARAEAIDFPSRQEWDQLRGRRGTLTSEIRAAQETLQLLSRLGADQIAYVEALALQADHFAPLSLFDEVTDGSCPVCGQATELITPTLEQMRSQYAALQDDLAGSQVDAPHLDRQIAEAEVRREALMHQLLGVNAALESMARQREEVERLTAEINEQSYVRGRIDHYLGTASSIGPSEIGVIRDRIAGLEEEVARAEAEIGSAAVRDSVVSILNVVGNDMTMWSAELGLEHAEQGVRVDWGRLTVVADTMDGALPLTRIGSGKNWVGYHLVTYLALQKFFIELDRPVPRFLVLDQFSQAFFPPGATSRQHASLTPADRAEVARMFDLLRRVVALLAPRLQILVLEHENPDRAGLESVVVEEWRGGTKLVPSDWP